MEEDTDAAAEPRSDGNRVAEHQKQPLLSDWMEGGRIKWQRVLSGSEMSGKESEVFVFSKFDFIIKW